MLRNKNSIEKLVEVIIVPSLGKGMLIIFLLYNVSVLVTI